MHNNLLLKRTLFVLILLYFQGFVLGSMQPLHGVISVYVYFFPILFFPIRTSVYKLVGVSVLLGAAMDIIFDSYGFFMMSSAWVGFFRNRILLLFFTPRKIKSIHDQLIINKHFSPLGFFVFLTILCSIHNAVLICLEWFTIMFHIRIVWKWLLDSFYSASVLVVLYHIVKKPLLLYSQLHKP